MSRDRSMPEGGTQARAERAMETGRHAAYLVNSSVDDILHEQLDYLISHTSQSCAPGCADCARLQQVQGWLLLPFRGARRTRSPRRAAQ